MEMKSVAAVWQETSGQPTVATSAAGVIFPQIKK